MKFESFKLKLSEKELTKSLDLLITRKSSSNKKVDVTLEPSFGNTTIDLGSSLSNLFISEVEGGKMDVYINGEVDFEKRIESEIVLKLK